MRSSIRFPLAAILLVASVLIYRFAERELLRTNHYVLSLYILAIIFFIAGALVLFNKLHRIVPDDWTPYS